MTPLASKRVTVNLMAGPARRALSANGAWILLAVAATASAASQDTAQPAPAPTRTDYNMPLAAQAPRLSSSELHGRMLYAKYCAVCHDAVSQPTAAVYGPPLSGELLKGLDPATVRKGVLDGSQLMPGFRYLLSASDLNDILGFLASYSGRAPAAVASSPTPKAAALDGATVIEGKVTEGDRPLDGVAVSARGAGRTVTTTVFTDAGGRYVFPPLAAGLYHMWAQAEGYGATAATADLAESRVVKRDFQMAKLQNADDLARQLSSGEWLDSLPAQTADDRRMKEILRLNCVECHSLSIPLQRRFDEKGWAAIIELMRQMDYDGWHGPTDPANPGFGSTGALNEMNRHYAGELAKYLARVRGPDSPAIAPKLAPRPSGAAARAVITGYDIPTVRAPTELSWQDGTIWSNGAASGTHSAVGVHDVIVNQAGDAWVTQVFFDDTREIMKVDAANGQVSAFDFPKTARTGVLQVRTHGLALDSKGSVWFGIDQRLVRIRADADSFEQFTPPAQLIDHMGNIGIDADGNDKLWNEGVPGIMRFDPVTATFSYYENAQHESPFFFTYGVAGDPRGNGWWTLGVGNVVQTANPSTGKVTEIVMHPPWIGEEEALATPADRAFKVPIGDGQTWGVYKPGFQYPRRLAADRNGTAIWVPNYFGRNLARIDVESKQVTYYRLPIDVHPYFVQVDRNHVVWMNSQSDDRVLTFDPATQHWDLYRLPINGCESRNINVDQKRGDVWLACYRAAKIFRIRPRASAAKR